MWDGLFPKCVAQGRGVFARWAVSLFRIQEEQLFAVAKSMDYKLSGVRPVCFAILANILEPISSLS